jgi:cytochrome c biogenesis protein CcdA
MSLGELGALVGLALVDSTSFGTFILPILLVIAANGVRVRAMAVYLGTVLVFYFLVGVLLLLGAGAAIQVIGDTFSDRTIAIGQLIIGVALFALSFRLDGRRESGDRTSRLQRIAGSPRAMIPLAFSATAVEVATMVPYLAAIGILTASDASLPLSLVVLAGYCLVMILPAILIVVIAAVLYERVRDRMVRFGAWMERQTASAMGWVVGAIGVLLALNAAGTLFG